MRPLYRPVQNRTQMVAVGRPRPYVRTFIRVGRPLQCRNRQKGVLQQHKREGLGSLQCGVLCKYSIEAHEVSIGWL